LAKITAEQPVTTRARLLQRDRATLCQSNLVNCYTIVRTSISCRWRTRATR